jgi:hypothetical protein
MRKESFNPWHIRGDGFRAQASAADYLPLSTKGDGALRVRKIGSDLPLDLLLIVRRGTEAFSSPLSDKGPNSFLAP